MQGKANTIRGPEIFDADTLETLSVEDSLRALKDIPTFIEGHLNAAIAKIFGNNEEFLASVIAKTIFFFGELPPATRERLKVRQSEIQSGNDTEKQDVVFVDSLHVPFLKASDLAHAFDVMHEARAESTQVEVTR